MQYDISCLLDFECRDYGNCLVRKEEMGTRRAFRFSFPFLWAVFAQVFGRGFVVGRHILSRRWNPHMSVNVAPQHLGASEHFASAPARRETHKRDLSCPSRLSLSLDQLDQNITGDRRSATGD